MAIKLFKSLYSSEPVKESKYLGMIEENPETDAAHYGKKRRSGRYPYGSGEDPYQHEGAFLGQVRDLRLKGMSDTDIARGMGMSTTDFRKKLSLETAKETEFNKARVLGMKEHGYSNVEIASKTGISEATVRNYLKEQDSGREKRAAQTAELLKKYVDEKKYVDVGPGTELYLDTTDYNLKNAIRMLEDQGYKVNQVYIDQMGTNHQTTLSVLTAPEVSYAELQDNKFDISLPTSKVYDEQGNIQELGTLEPKSIDSKRIYIRYGDQGGSEMDGTLQLRRGVDDISLGNANYAQVRVAVDGKYYMKGMAMYGDDNDIPKGYDVVYNTNKPSGSPDSKVFKSMKTDKDGNIDIENPFGATIKDERQLTKAQRFYIDENGEKQQSCINVVNEQGDWDTWSRSLSSQFLSKQSTQLAEQQLNLKYEQKLKDYNDILAVNNPVVKKQLLQAFAQGADEAAVDLSAAAVPRQASKVILPFNDLKENEIYAPGLKNGDVVCLVRHPHGSIAEIPTLVVNNKNTKAKDIIFNAPDAVGINSKVAERLSGADFDGDTVIVIPLSDKVRVNTSDPLPGLVGFSSKMETLYKLPDDAPGIKPKTKQLEMGKVSNLITDMTLKGADSSEIERAIKHSMVVIDSEKHHYDHKKSYEENGIEDLKKRYQDNGDGHFGASTIISRASSEVDILERKDNKGLSAYDPETGRGTVDPATGKLIFKTTGKTHSAVRVKNEDDAYVNVKGASGKSVKTPVKKNEEGIYILNGQPVDQSKVKFNKVTKTVYYDKNADLYFYSKRDENGNKERVYVDNDIVKTKANTQKSTKMFETDDAYKLTSGGSKENPGTKMESIYANYANKMKALANEARKSYISTPNLEYNREAAKKYKDAVESLNTKLKIALINSPKERQAQLLANAKMQLILNEHPELKDDKDHLKKEKGRALNTARQRVGAKKQMIDISDYEWEAIQAGAISGNKLSNILLNADLDRVKKLATPRPENYISPSDAQLAKTMSSAGYTTADIAERLGVSSSTVSNIIN